jgi:cell division protein FtsB
MPPTVSKEPHSRLRWLRSRLAYLAVIAFMVFFAYSYLQKTKDIKALAQQESALRAANAAVSADNARVSQSIAYYQSLAYVEERARSDLGWTKSGEFIVQSNPRWQQVPTVRAAPPRPTATPEAVWQQWVDVFTR